MVSNAVYILIQNPYFLKKHFKWKSWLEKTHHIAEKTNEIKVFEVIFCGLFIL